MIYQSKNVPFRITDINLGFQEAGGVIRLSGKRIIIEYRVKDALGLSIKSDIKEIHLPLEELENLEIIDWWLTLRLVISVKSLKVFDELPNVESGEAKLKVARKHRKVLKEFVSKARLARSEILLEQLDET